jgi:hypothetical protein
MLSTFGLWRAEVERHTPDIGGLKNARMVKEFVGHLVRHWSIRSGWPCTVLSVSRVKPTKPNAAGAQFEGRIDRVSLVDQWSGFSGWIRFGDGFIEFEVEPIPPQEIPATEPVLLEESKQLVTAELSHAPAEQEFNPLWDRWLDG